ncbi:MAG: hypothetical protein WCD20_04725 [Rhodomicrobium sp.]
MASRGWTGERKWLALEAPSAQSLFREPYARIGTMTDLLQHAFETVRRLPPTAQDHIAEAMLALADEESAGFEFTLPGDAPSEEEIAALMPVVMPSPVPTRAEAAAWSRLPREEQLRRYREALDRPGAMTVCADTMDDILAEAHRRSDERSGG